MSSTETAPDKSPRPAASIMLMRDGDRGPEVLMVQRAARGPFPNLHVFPGGKVEDSENPEDWSAHCIGPDDAKASARLGLPQGGLKYWIASIRECFEETGILLAEDAGGRPVGHDRAQSERLLTYRRQLNEGQADQMLRMCIGENLKLNLDNIAYSSHWITPKLEMKRFTTRFFVAAMPAGQEPIQDGKELVDCIWITPEGALDASKRGELNLILPTIENLKNLCGFDSAADVVAARAAQQQIPPILPKFVKIDGAWTGLLPSDPRYDRYDG